jgi:hypothetical protein
MIFPVEITIEYEVEADSLEKAMAITYTRWLDLGNYDYDRKINWLDAGVRVDGQDLFRYDDEKYA